MGNDRLIVAHGDNLFTLTVASSPMAARIGPEGLGKPGSAVSVSPDGRTIAFVQDDSVWRMGVDGTGLSRLTQRVPNTGWVSWSPDGTRLVVRRGACPVIAGDGYPDPGVVVISSTTANQDIMALDPVRFACGLVYWLP